MSQIWFYTITSVLIISLISLIGVFTLSLRLESLKKVVFILVSLAAGTLLGDSFIHLLPEAVGESGFSLSTSLGALSGMMMFFILEKIIHWRHCHIPTCKDHPHPMGMMNLVGDSIHNFIDGMIIAGSYLVSVPLGVATTIAVILHEIPQEIGDFGILIHAGYSRSKALFYNFLTALTAVIGAVITILISNNIELITNFLIPFTAGGFIYIATADLIPELKKETDLVKSLTQLVFLILGMGVMVALLGLE